MELPQQGLAILSILKDIWSIPVAFLILILFICFSTNSSETGLKNNSLLQSFVIHLSLILQILEWQSFIGVESLVEEKSSKNRKFNGPEYLTATVGLI